MGSTTQLLVASPYSLAKESCMFGIRCIFIVIQTLIEMLRAAIYFQLNTFWGIIIWAIAMLSLPVRALTALQREKMFEMRINEMQMELENLIWAKKKLDEQLKSAINERRMVEALLVELEDEYDEAICKMDLLEGELCRLKVENQHLKEAQVKSLWSSDQHAKDAGMFKIKGPSPKSKSTAGENIVQADIPEDEKIKRSPLQGINKAMSKAKTHGTAQAHSNDTDSWYAGMDSATLKKREIALSHSFFSAVLAVLVGAIVWEAKDPCMPLITALFAVAVISLRTVIVYLSTIRNKPAMDAVVLLSFNWFMLGLLSYPTLPVVAHSLPSMFFNSKDGGNL